MRRLFAALALALTSAPAMAKDCVVLLHGLGRTHWSMIVLQRSLEDAGYTVWNEGYPSTRATVEQLAPVVGEAIEACRAQKAKKIHFVTHSMGGILVRAYFRDATAPEAGRVVMLAPPNHGSAIVDANRDAWWFRWSTGPAGQQLGTAADSLPNTLPALPLEVGIIAGRHDGKVSVASTALAGMKEQLVVDSAHTFIMNSPTVIRQVKAFLKDG
ncbi:MAG: esterase/lipase family protein, partial [Nevskiaceae bacterium]